MLNNPFCILSHGYLTNERKSHFVRLNEKCPKMHLIEMKIRMEVIIYGTNDVYIRQKVSTVLCPRLQVDDDANRTHKNAAAAADGMACVVALVINDDH